MSRPEAEPAEGVAANGRPRESVWDYPRPPAIREEDREVVVTLRGEPVARSSRGAKVLAPASGQTYCEWKGSASYYDVVAGGHMAERAAWAYHEPTDAFQPIRDWVAFYPRLVECELGGERVEPQPGEFYGGWVTAEITGPFKGIPGSTGW
jgi:uncharacterized protein (DUF427 family)